MDGSRCLAQRLGRRFADDCLTMTLETRRVVCIDTIYGRFFSYESDLITDQLIEFSAHTRNELAMLRSVVRAGDNVLDIGAHIGTYSIPLSQFIQGGKLFAFEANLSSFNLLVKNIHANNLGDIATPIHGAAARQGDLLYSPVLPSGGNSGMYYFQEASKSLAQDACRSINIGEWYSQLTLAPQIDFVKVDVEGAELVTLRSLEQLLQSQKPKLYVEINEVALSRFGASVGEMDRFLTDLGYEFFRNVGPRNSGNDFFSVSKVQRLADGGPFFDVLALPRLG